MTPDQMAELAARLHDFGKAYPVEIFPEITDAEHAEHSRLITRAAAQMGRHFAKFAVPAADLIESMAQAKPVAWAATDESGTVVEALGMNQSRRFDTALYLAPPAREPLTDEQIWSLWKFPADLSWKESVIKLGHAIEQAHEIRSEG